MLLLTPFIVRPEEAKVLDFSSVLSMKFILFVAFFKAFGAK